MQARTGNIVGSVGFAGLSAWVLVQSAALDDRAAIFPRVAAGLVLIGALITFARSMMEKPVFADGVFAGVSWHAVSYVIGVFALGLAGLKPVGFPLMAGVFFFAVSMFLDGNPRTPVRVALHLGVAIAFTCVSAGLFISVLGVSLPLGPFER